MTAGSRRVRGFYAAVAAVAGLAGGFAAAGWTQRYPVLAIDELVVASTPAAVVNATIQTLGEDGHLLHLGLSGAIAFGVLTAIAFAGLLGAHSDLVAPPGGAVWAAVVAGGLSAALTGALLPAAATGVSLGLGVAVGERSVAGPLGDEDPDRRRRSVLTLLGTLAYAGLSLSVGSLVTRRAREVDVDALPEAELARERLADAAETDLGVEGLQPPVSPVGTFYTVSIDSTPPIVETADWQLTVRGAVERELTVDYDDLRERPVEHRFVALRCIGESLNAHQLDTGLWTGTPLAPLLAAAGPTGDFVELHAADGYVATFSRPLLSDGLLAYGMNAEPLPRQHGFPARMVLPGTWGKLNVKWVTDVVFREEPTEGFWEQRGWNSEAPITTVAKCWTVDELGDGRVEVGGHAYAGTRGIERVEVSTDGGATWGEAELADPLPGRDVSRQWRHRYEADGPHEVVVRAVDGEGRLQTDERTDAFPSGAAGWVRRTVEP